MHQHLEHLETLSAQFKFIVRGQRFQCHSRKTHVNINCPAVRTKGFAINGNADDGALIASSKYSNSRFYQDCPKWFPNSSLLTSAFCWVAQCRRLLDTLRSSPFSGLQSYPPRPSGIPRRIPLQRIARHLLPIGLVLRRKRLLADVHFPRLSTSRTPLHICLLGFEVILRSRSRRGFHFPQHLG